MAEVVRHGRTTYARRISGLIRAIVGPWEGSGFVGLLMTAYYAHSFVNLIFGFELYTTVQGKPVPVHCDHGIVCVSFICRAHRAFMRLSEPLFSASES